MEELRKLIDILERKGKGSASALINYNDTASLETRLYQLAQTNSDSSEADLISLLYSDATKKGAFKMLKSRVKRKLYNQLYFLDAENEKLADQLASVEIRCRKMLYQADVLRKLQEADLAEQILLKVSAIAQDSQLIKYEIDALEQLRMYYSERIYERKLFEKCVTRLEQLYQIFEIERKVDSIYFDVRFEMKLGVEANHKLLNRLEGFIQNVELYLADFNTGSVFRRFHQLKVMYFELSGDFETYIAYLNYTFEKYNTGKIHPLYFSINYNKYSLVFACLRAKKYDQGLREADDLKGKLEPGSVNWFAHLENYFLLATHSQNYKRASKVLDEVLANKYLKETNTFAKERWVLFYDFLHYVSGYTSEVTIDRKLKHVTQDKKGYNVWSLILEFVHVLEKKQPDLLQREIDRVRKFISKYLVAPEDARTKLFLKLLLVAGRDYTDAKSCARKGKYLFNKLHQTPAAGIAYAETEIIPFEHLWELILQKMESK